MSGTGADGEAQTGDFNQAQRLCRPRPADVTEDLARDRPDVILVDNRQQVPWTAWINSYEPLAEQMRAYQKVQTVGEIEILRRR